MGFWSPLFAPKVLVNQAGQFLLQNNNIEVANLDKSSSAEQKSDKLIDSTSADILLQSKIKALAFK